MKSRISFHSDEDGLTPILLPIVFKQKYSPPGYWHRKVISNDISKGKHLAYDASAKESGSSYAELGW